MTVIANTKRLQAFHAAVAAVAPIIGSSVGSWSDRSTWIINFDTRTGATPPTQAQIDAANNVIATFDPTADETRLSSLQTDAQVAALAAQLASMSSAQIDTYFANNVTTAAQAISVLKTVVKLLAYDLGA